MEDGIAGHIVRLQKFFNAIFAGSSNLSTINSARNNSWPLAIFRTISALGQPNFLYIFNGTAAISK